MLKDVVFVVLGDLDITLQTLHVVTCHRAMSPRHVRARLDDPGVSRIQLPYEGIALPGRSDHSCTAEARGNFIYSLPWGQCSFLGAEHLAQLFPGGVGVVILGPRCGGVNLDFQQQGVELHFYCLLPVLSDLDN